MNTLSYKTLEEIGYKGFLLKEGKEKVMQFGEGNFLRAFVDDFIDIANEKTGYNGKIVIVQPIAAGLTDVINSQDGLYTLYLRGNDNGTTMNEKRLISAVSRCIDPYRNWDDVLTFAKSDDLEIITSNTTEAGIAYDPESTFDQIPPVSFPAKLTRVLYERFTAGKKGVVILSCELIDNNGKELLKCVNQYIDDWKLSDEFRTWINEENIFCSTLVDRIVPGRIKDAAEAAQLNEENGYIDNLTDVGEYFGVWIIEGPEGLEDRLPFKAAGVPVQVVPDVTPYKKRKVRILNGAHTGFVLGAYLAGFDIVRDCMNDDVVSGFMNKMLYEEVIPTLPLDRDDLMQFTAAVKDRFNNPFVNHELMSISLNSTSKWRARNMPSLTAYTMEQGKLPKCLATSLAALIAFYSNDVQELTDAGLVCRRPAGNTYTVSDDRRVLEFFYAHKDDSEEALVNAVMTDEVTWGEDLTKIAGFEEEVVAVLKKIRVEGAKAAFADCL